MKARNYILALIAIVTFTITGCQKVPTASFTSDKENYVNGETMKLTNTSQDAYSYKWTVTGSSTQITTKDAEVSLNGAGQYTVTLTTYSRNGKKSDDISKTFTVAKATGQVTFYTLTSSLGTIDVDVDGVPMGTITLYYASAPACAANGCVTVNLEEGTHTVDAYANGTGQSVSATITVVGNTCNKFEM
jgi:PKD repeat protein